jgi:hypothetical protein
MLSPHYGRVSRASRPRAMVTATCTFRRTTSPRCRPTWPATSPSTRIFPSLYRYLCVPLMEQHRSDVYVVVVVVCTCSFGCSLRARRTREPVYGMRACTASSAAPIPSKCSSRVRSLSLSQLFRDNENQSMFYDCFRQCSQPRSSPTRLLNLLLLLLFFFFFWRITLAQTAAPTAVRAMDSATPESAPATLATLAPTALRSVPVSCAVACTCLCVEASMCNC